MTDLLWGNVTNGGPKGFVFSPVLIKRNINDLDKNGLSNIGKVPNHEKLGRSVRIGLEFQQIQTNLNKIVFFSKEKKGCR